MPQQASMLEHWLQPFIIDTDKLCALTHQLSSTYTHLALHSDEQFLATPVTRLPTGEEKGEYLAIDLGGSNLRVAFVTLRGAGSHHQKTRHIEAELGVDGVIQKKYEKSWPIDAHLKADKPEHLFAWLGDCLAEVINDRLQAGDAAFTEIPLGIAFSFPMIQSTLAEATLLPMGKGFAISGNPDLGKMVLAGYARHTSTLPRIKIVAIANDAVTTLISLCYAATSHVRSKAVIGLIMGTGCNAAVRMKATALDPAKLSKVLEAEKTGEMVINTEWTIKGVAKPLRELGLITHWDVSLDQAISTPGFQPFEYMTAGHYLGEIVRLVVLDWMANEMNIESATIPPVLVKPYALTSTFLTRNVAPAKNSHELAATMKLMGGEFMFKRGTWTPELAGLLLRVERAVLLRSSAMIAAAIVGLLISAGELTLRITGAQTADEVEGSGATRSAKELVVAYCGGLICLYPGYKERIQATVDQLVNTIIVETDVRVVFREASEGGVIGAGVLAGTNWSFRP